MNQSSTSARQFEAVGPRGVKEERDLRHALGVLTFTAAALFGSLIATAGADDGQRAAVPSEKPTAKPAAESPAKEIVKKRRYVAALIDSARDDLELGRVDLAQAKAAAVRKIQSAYHFLDERATRVLVQIDRLAAQSRPEAGPRCGRAARRARTIPLGLRIGPRFSIRFRQSDAECRQSEPC